MARADAAVDTSIAVALLVSTHQAHAAVLAALQGERLALPHHALIETYSVLTRLPGEARVALADAVRLLDHNFEDILMPKPASVRSLHRDCAALGIGGGATYDAWVAAAARDHGVPLLTRDRRAGGTYQALGIAYSMIATA